MTMQNWISIAPFLGLLVFGVLMIPVVERDRRKYAEQVREKRAEEARKNKKS